MIALTLLDGTQISLPAPRRKMGAALRAGLGTAPQQQAGPFRGRGQSSLPPDSPDADDHQMTARDLVLALKAIAHGAGTADEVLGDHSWERMFAALLGVLLNKHLIADWEFIDELKKL